MHASPDMTVDSSGACKRHPPVNNIVMDCPD